MKKTLLTLAFGALGTASFAQFIPNGLAVSVIGDGSAALSGNATQATLDAFDKTSTGQGQGVMVVNMSSGGAGARITNSGSDFGRRVESFYRRHKPQLSRL